MTAIHATLIRSNCCKRSARVSKSWLKSLTGQPRRSDAAHGADDGAVPRRATLRGKRARCVRTSKPGKEKLARRSGRQPLDPFVTVAALMRGWFEAEPWRIFTRII